MNVKQLIEKLNNVGQDSQVYLDDGFSVNVIEVETVYLDKTNFIIVVSPSDFEEDNESIKTL